MEDTNKVQVDINLQQAIIVLVWSSQKHYYKNTYNRKML